MVLDQVHEDLNQSVTATADSDEQGKLAAQVLQGQVERCEAIVASAGDGATVRYACDRPLSSCQVTQANAVLFLYCSLQAAQQLALAAAQGWHAHVERNYSVVSRLFHGQLLSRVACPRPECQHVASSFDATMYLTLPVPQQPVQLTVTTTTTVA